MKIPKLPITLLRIALSIALLAVAWQHVHRSVGVILVLSVVSVELMPWMVELKVRAMRSQLIIDLARLGVITIEDAVRLSSPTSPSTWKVTPKRKIFTYQLRHKVTGEIIPLGSAPTLPEQYRHIFSTEPDSWIFETMFDFAKHSPEKL